VIGAGYACADPGKVTFWGKALERGVFEKWSIKTATVPNTMAVFNAHSNRLRMGNLLNGHFDEFGLTII
jgi:hypothetical protein